MTNPAIIAAAEGDVGLAHLVDQLVHDLVVEKLQGTRTLVDDRDLRADLELLANEVLGLEQRPAGWTASARRAW